MGLGDDIYVLLPRTTEVRKRGPGSNVEREMVREMGGGACEFLNSRECFLETDDLFKVRKRFPLFMLSILRPFVVHVCFGMGHNAGWWEEIYTENGQVWRRTVSMEVNMRDRDGA